MSVHQAAGEALISEVLGDLARRGLELAPDERLLLDLAADTADDLASMRARVRRDGLVVTNRKSGATKSHPLLPIIATRAAQHQRQLAALGKVLAVPDEDADLGPADRFRRGQRAHGGRGAARARQEGRRGATS